MGILKKIVLCIFTGIMGTSIVFSQTIKFRSISLRSFPWISMIISVENRLGEHVPVDLSGLLLFEKDQVIRDVEIIPQDSLALPIFTVIVLDKSGSMRGEPIENAKDGAVAFVKAMREGDQAAYVEFDTEVEIMTRFIYKNFLFALATNLSQCSSISTH